MSLNHHHPQSYANAVTGTSNSMANQSPSTRVNADIDTDTYTTVGDETGSINNNSHPLYLHNNDQPGMVLISKKLIGSENYASWKRSIQIALSAKNKLVILTGEYKAPDEKSPAFSQWKRVNDMVIIWILNTVSDEISSSMHYLDSAFNVWSELSERFSAVSGQNL